MKYFGTDGIRGKAYEVLSLDLVYKLGRALAILPNQEFIIGIDPRESSIDIVKALISGITDIGKKYRYAGVISTPGLMYYSMSHHIFGIMVTASHNPYYDNGLKLFDNGLKLAEVIEGQIEDEIAKNDLNYQNKDIDLIIDKSINEYYLEYLKKFKPQINNKILIDCANGATSHIINNLFTKENIINNNPDGKNINQKCGSTNLNMLIQKVIEGGYDYGFAFDGDGDRVIAVDKDNIYDGDLLLYILVKYYKRHDLLNSSFVILTSMSNLGIIEAYKNEDLNPLIVDVGDKNIFRALDLGGFEFGAEASGHIINRHISPFGDGIVNMFQIIDILQKEKMVLATYTKDVNLAFVVTKNIKCNYHFSNNKCYQQKIRHLKKTFSGTILIRKSGTEPLLRITVMSYNAAENDLILEKIFKIIRQYEGTNKNE